MRLRIVVMVTSTVVIAAGGGDDADGTSADGRAMTITFERSGGFAGITRSVTVSSDSLSAEGAAELRRLIDEARFFQLPEEAGEGHPVADDFSYVITIDDGERSGVVHTGDADAPHAVRPLLDWLNSVLRSGGGSTHAAPHHPGRAASASEGERP